MKKTKIGKHDVSVYDSIDELPMRRFHRFNKMMLVQSGVGSDLTDVDTHLERIKAFIATKKPDLAINEIENLRTNIYFIMQDISPKFLAFAALVDEIDGEKVTDISDDGLTKVVEKLADTTIAELNKEFDSVKKKIEEDLLLYFPQMFDDSSVKEFYDLVRKRTLAILNGIIDGNMDNWQESIDNITTELLIYNRPQLYSGSDSIEVQFDRQFDRMCHIISYHLNVSPKDYTVTEYYSAFDYIKEIIKAKKQSLRK